MSPTWWPAPRVGNHSKTPWISNPGVLTRVSLLFATTDITEVLPPVEEEAQAVQGYSTAGSELPISSHSPDPRPDPVRFGESPWQYAAKTYKMEIPSLYALPNEEETLLNNVQKFTGAGSDATSSPWGLTTHEENCPMHDSNSLFDEEVCTCWCTSKPAPAYTTIEDHLDGSIGGFTMDYSTLSFPEKAELIPSSSLRADMIKYASLRQDRTELAPPYESLRETARQHKYGKSVENHLLAANSSQRQAILSTINRRSVKDKRSRYAAPASAGAYRPLDARQRVIYIRSSNYVARPATYSFLGFRTWVHAEASRLAKVPGQVPVLNEAACLLYDNKALHPEVQEHLYSTATVLSLSWSELKCEHATVSHLRREVAVRDILFTKEEDLNLYADIFSKNKPLRRNLLHFLQDGDGVDPGKLTAALDKAFRNVLPRTVDPEDNGIADFSLDDSEWPELGALETIKEEGEAVRQGNGMSGMVMETVDDLQEKGTMNAFGKDFGSGFAEGVVTRLTPDFPPIAHQILNMLLGFAAIASAETPTQYTIAVLHTLVNDKVALGIAWSLTSLVRQGAENDNMEIPWYTKLAGLSAISSIRSFLGDVYAALIPSFLEMCGAVKFASLKQMATGMADWIATMLVEFVARIKGCFEERSLQPLLGVDAARWCRHSKGLFNYYSYIVSKGDAKIFKTLTNDLPLEFRLHMTHAEFALLLEEHIARGNAILPLVSVKYQKDMGTLLAKMDGLLCTVKLDANGHASRIEPFCGLFYGQPGTGKTTLCENISRACAFMELRDKNDIYHFKQENFRTTLRSSTVVIRMDDPDASLVDASAGFEDHCKFIQSMVSSNAYPIEQAGVEEKGKHFARPTDVIITSNFKHLHANRFVSEPGAVWRRSDLYIECKVKPEYALEDGRLDMSKTHGDGSFGLYTVSVYLGAGESGKELQLMPVLTNVEYVEMLQYYMKARKAKLLRQSVLRNAESEVCKDCFFPVCACICTVRQGAIQSTGSSFSACCDRVAFYFEQHQGIGLLASLAIGSAVAVASMIKLVLQGRDAGLTNDSWFRASTFKEPAFPASSPTSWTLEELKKIVTDSLVTVTSKDEHGSTVNGVIYQPGFVLFPTHVFGVQGTAEVTYRGLVSKIRKDSPNCKLLMNAELSIVEIPGLTRCNGIRKHMVEYTVNAKRMGPAFLIGLQNSYAFAEVTSSMENQFPTWSYPNETVDGDCGSVLIAEGPGGGYRVYGLHMFYRHIGSSKSVQICAENVRCIISSPVQRTFYQGLTLTGKPPSMAHYPEKSEVSVAVTYYDANVINWGTGPCVGRSMTTAIRKTSFYDKVVEFAQSQGIEHDLEPAVLKGGMLDGLYYSPYIHAIRDSNRSATSYMKYTSLYSNSVRGHFGGPLSEHECIVGVPGVFNSVNDKTSMGAPYYGPKTAHLSKMDAEMSPELCAGIDELEEILARGEVPGIHSEAMLKDEVVRKGKPARVFCMLPAAFNLVCKKYFAPLKTAMRASYFASKCAVGLDMGSRKVEDLVDFLKGYDHLYGVDLKRMDKMWTPEAWDAVAQTIFEITEFSAGTDIATKAKLLVLSMKESLIYLKGDFFSPFWNISGNDITVELNSILLSLMMYRMQDVLGLQFDFITYGDDNIICTDTLLPESFFVSFNEETGFTATDDSKRETPQAVTIREVTFLKRNFRFDSEFSVWTAPLSEKSLIKMLMFRGKSSLSPLDHEAELADAAVRYALLHGRERFAVWCKFIESLGHVPRLDYDFAMADYKSGNFTDWCEREVAVPQRPVVTYQSKMTETNTSVVSNEAPPSIVPPHEVQESVISGTQLTADVLQVAAPAAVIEVEGSKRFNASNLRHYPLDNFLNRWTKISSTVFSGTDVANSRVLSLNVTSSLLNNPAFAEKTKNWTFWRSDIEIMGIVDLPGNASGAYCFTALPHVEGGNVNRVVDSTVANCMQTDYYHLMLASSSGDFSMTLPFFNNHDSADFTSMECAWYLQIFCISPLRSSIAGGVTQGRVSIMARFKEDYELYVPRWQGKSSLVDRVKEHRANKTVSKTAAAIQGVAGKLVGVPVIGSAAAAIAGVAGSVGAIADFFGFTRENEQTAIQTFQTRSVTNVANVDGIENSDVAGFSVRNHINIDPSIVGGPKEDNLSFASIANRWTMVASTVWSASHTENTILKTVYVTPGYSLGNVDRIYPTGAGYCGLPFQYWRADAEYKIVIPASVLHRGSVQLLYYPDTAVIPSGTANTNVGLGAVLDISSETIYDVTVGYSQNKPMLDLAYWNDSTFIIPVALCNGAFQIKVLNPLVSQNPGDEINIAVFARFKNLQLAVPRVSLNWSDTKGLISNTWPDAFTYQAGAVGDHDVGKPANELEMVPSSGPYAVSDIVAGEEISSFRALMQKPSQLLTTTNNVAIGFGALSLSDNTYPRVTTASLGSVPFVLVAASERIKIFPQYPTWLAAGSVPVEHLSGPIPVNTYLEGMSITWAGPQVGAQFHIPYYAPRRGRIPNFRGDSFATDAERAIQQRLVKILASGEGEHSIFYSLGDDIRVGPFARLPTLLMTLESEPPQPWLPV